MKILRLEADNFKRLKCVRIDAFGSVMQITGANGSGKSSVLDAIYAALAGKSAAPGTPIRQGEKSARITLDLGELIVTRKFTEGGTSLIVETAAGARFPSPQGVLDSLLGALTFDPLEFMRMKRGEQRDEIARIAGLSAMLRDSERSVRALYDARTEVNRDLKTAKARLETTPEVAEVEPVDVSATVAELRAAREHNQLVADAAAQRADDKRRLEQLNLSAKGYRAEAARIIALAESVEAEAKCLLREMHACPPLPELVPIEPLEHRLEQAEAINAQRRAYLDRAKVVALVGKLTAESQQFSDDIIALEHERAAAVRNASLPIEGLGLSDDGVTYRGLPLDQASGAEQLRVSLAIAMAANPTLRVLRVKDGSLLDEQSLAIVQEMVRDRDYQLWIERVDTSGRIGVVMEDGEVQPDPFDTAAELAEVTA